MSQRTLRTPRRAHTQVQRQARRFNVERQKPGWLIQHGSPNRRARRGYDAIVRDFSGKNLVKQLQRVIGCDPITAAMILRDLRPNGDAVAKRERGSRRPLPYAGVAEATEAARGTAPYSGAGIAVSKREIRKLHVANRIARELEAASHSDAIARAIEDGPW